MSVCSPQTLMTAAGPDVVLRGVLRAGDSSAFAGRDREADGIACPLTISASTFGDFAQQAHLAIHGEDPLAEEVACPVASLTFGALLKNHRFVLGLSQAALAGETHVSRSQIKEIERGQTRPSPELAALLADYFRLIGTERAAFLTLARAPLPPAPAPAARGRPPQPACSRALGASNSAMTPGPRRPLPCPLTPLVGRVHETEVVIRRLTQPGVRLLTLTGPPGIGKTRLALAAAGVLRAAYPAGVVFVSLASIHDPELVLPTIAETVGLSEGVLLAPEERLAEVLGRRLLVLDNCEQVLGAAPAVAALLTAAPALQVLVTSREVLHVYGEYEFPVPPLAVPDGRQRLPCDHLGAYDAVALFVQRAQAAKPDFALTIGNAAAVAALCVHLDGLPLAIELAAARSKLLSPTAMIAHLEHGLELLSGGPRDRSARQQTWRGALDWSYDLLTPVEQAVFRRLAVFPGGWTEEAAAAVCPLPTDAPFDLEAVLSSLIAKNLVSVAAAGENGPPRFYLLKTIRAYAWERLQQAAAERFLLQHQHACYYGDDPQRLESRGRAEILNYDQPESLWATCPAS